MEKTVDTRRVGTSLLATAMALTGVGLTAAISADAYAAPAPACAEQDAAASPVASVTKANARGAFSFTQDRVSSNADIATTFRKAASLLCAAAPNHGAQAMAASLQLTSPQASMAATLDDFAEDSGAPVARMGCACSSNAAGGGAIANADVSGVPLAFLAQFAQAR